MRSIWFAALFALAACDRTPTALTAPQAESAAAPSPAASIDPTALEGRIVALGRNPEWRLDADAQLGMVLVMPEQGLTFSAEFAPPQRANAGAVRLAARPLTLELDPESCALNGVTYPMRASAQVEQGEPLVGCAFVRWDWRLIELLPAIDACISLSPNTRQITYAALEENGRVLVRLHGASETPKDCRAPLTPGAPAIVTPTDANLLIAGDGDAIFVRAPGQNPGGECYEAPEVRAADGELLGWMDDPLGC